MHRKLNRLPYQPMLALMNWISSRMIMSSQLAMAASTMTASQIMMGMGITSCTQMSSLSTHAQSPCLRIIPVLLLLKVHCCLAPSCPIKQDLSQRYHTPSVWSLGLQGCKEWCPSDNRA